MKNRLALLFMQFLLLLMISTSANSQIYSIAVQRVFSQQELDQMLAPIALYPDPLLSQILMAATYPPELEQAADWSRANPHLRGDEAVRAIDGFNWEPSVKSMVAFPEILSVMAARMDWTVRLGDAFLGQQQQVIDTIQYLRRKAMAAGNLRSDERIRVVSRGSVIVIEPAVQQVVYVPYYNPMVVYGSWWWPSYAPVYWSPWPGYYQPRGYRGGFYWGSATPVGTGLFFGYFDWSHRHVYVRPYQRWQYWRDYDRSRRYEWQHNPDHRHGTPYRQESVRKRYDRRDGNNSRVQEERYGLRGYASNPARGRDADAGRTSLSTRPVPSSNAAPPAHSRIARESAKSATVGTSQISRPNASGSRQPAPAAVGGHMRSERRPSAFEGMDKGRDERSYGSRGRASRSDSASTNRAVKSEARPSPSSGRTAGHGGTHRKD